MPSLDSGCPIEEQYYHLLHHSLGISDPKNCKPYRNYFAADEGHADIEGLRSLCDADLMIAVESQSTENQDIIFIVTDKGRKVALRTQPRPPKLTRAQARYQRYLDLADSLDMSFIEYCRCDAEPERTWNR